MPRNNPRFSSLPEEIKRHIIGYVGSNNARMSNQPASLLSLPPAFTPPANGASPFMKLPPELRRPIFAESLPGRDAIHHPTCSSDAAAARPSSRDDKTIVLRRNKVSDLMTLHKTITDEIAEVVYEERYFIIHVHEGLVNGGVEFLNAGRQPLHYLNLDMMEDNRFVRFGKDRFSFRRLKKIIVQIHPSTEDQCRHTAVNTHFMIKALCHLLDRSGETKNRITRLEVEFPKMTGGTQKATGRRAILQREQYWWDPDTKQPRATTIHRLSNIELVLRPFEMLPCHSARIQLPENIDTHQPTIDFVSRLERTMTSTDSMMRFADDDLEMKMEGLRKEMEDYVTYTVHGKGFHNVVDLADTEMHEEEVDGSTEDSDSVIDDEVTTLYGGFGKPGQTEKEWRDEQRVMLESIQAAQAEEARLVEEATAASTNDSASNASSDLEMLPGNPYSDATLSSSTVLPIRSYAQFARGEVIDLTSSPDETGMIDLTADDDMEDLDAEMMNAIDQW